MSTTDDKTRKRPHNETNTTTFQLDNSHQNQDGALNNNSGASKTNGGAATSAGEGATNKAQENNKRRQILLQSNKNWGLRELLVECGLVEFSMNEERDGKSTPSSLEYGCQLSPSTSSSKLRSSIYALLNEMNKNQIDINNVRILKDMEDLIVGTADGDEGGEEGGEGEGNKDENGLLRKMLLPLYRIKTKGPNTSLSQFSQFSQPDQDDNTPNNNEGGVKTKTIVESSSLIKVLLRIDILQPTLLSVLLSKIPELAMSDSSNEEESTNNNNKSSSDIPRLIFQSMKWLDHIVNYQQLTQNFIECMTLLSSNSMNCITSRNVLLDVIGMLPDVLSDCISLDGSSDNMLVDEDEDEDSGTSILSTLQSLRQEDPSLLIPVLDAMSSLPLSEQQLELVVNDALEALSNVERWGLPALTTFLMNHCPSGKKSTLVDVVDGLRNLPLGNSEEEENEMEVDNNMGGHGGRAANTSSGSACLTIESISRGFAHRADLTSTLLKCIKDTPSSAENGHTHHPTADIWLLVCAASALHNRSKVKNIFKSKANSGLFTSRLLREALCGNGVALGSLFETLCDLADGLLRSSSSLSPLESSGGGAACELGVTLYEILFEDFHEPLQRQEIVGSLVTHVGSGVGVNSNEVDAALRVFCCIADKKEGSNGEGVNGAMVLKQYYPFLSSMLQHLKPMSSSQLRRLFLLLFAVGYEGSEDKEDVALRTANSSSIKDGMRGSDGCADIHIVIAKHLALAPLSMKKIGIIGSVAYAVSRWTRDEDTTIIGESSTAAASSPVVKEIEAVIKKAYNECKSSASSSGRSSFNLNSNSATHTVNLGNAFSNGSSMAFFFDELCLAVKGGRLSSAIQEWIEELVQQDFENNYVGDYHEDEEEEEDDDAMDTKKKGTKSAGNEKEMQLLGGNDGQLQIPTSSVDLSLLDGSSKNPMAPPGELRFSIEGAESAVYLKVLPLLSSCNVNEREYLPVQCVSIFRLMSTICNAQYGGRGLAEIDAMLECPLLLPSAESSGFEMWDDMGATKQWVITASYFFATCWIRQLINSFIYAAAADDSNNAMETAGSFTASSQGFNAEEVQKKIVARLRALVDLEEELRFTASKCYTFAPPGLDILAPPKELTTNYSNNVDDENLINTSVDTTGMSKEEKKAITAAKKQQTKQAKDKQKAKQKAKKAKKQHEQELINRTLGALRPLNSQVCLALGFKELSLGPDASQSQALSQLPQVTTCGTPVTMLLLKLLQRTLSDSLSEKKKGTFKAGGSIDDDGGSDNPYMATNRSPTPSSSVTTTYADIALASCEDSSKKCFALLDSFLSGGVFISLYENLAAVTELRCGQNKTDDDEVETRLVETAKVLFSSVECVMSSERLTRSQTGKIFLSAILKQISEGDRSDYGSDPKHRRPSAASMNKMLGYVADNVNEIVTGAYTADLEFAMDGIKCMESILDCSKRISDEEDDDADTSSSLSVKLSNVAEALLKQSWPDDTKMNKGNVGKLLSLFIEHSTNRLKSLKYVVDEVLLQMPSVEKGQGVDTSFPTCTHQTFPTFFGITLENLWKELVMLFDSSFKSTDPDIVLKRLKDMIGLLQELSTLTKKHDSLAKTNVLLQQLKFGSRFMETFVSKAIPYFQVKGRFEEHEKTILTTIQMLQVPQKQLSYIISHAKREKIAILVKEAPRAKKANESFTHKVKALLKKNRCVTAMDTKTLKEKDIDGTTLRSQTEDEEGSVDEDDSSEDDNEDDSDGDEDGSDDDNTANSEDEYDTDE